MLYIWQNEWINVFAQQTFEKSVKQNVLSAADLSFYHITSIVSNFFSSRAIRSSICLFWLQRLFICTESVKWRNTGLSKELSAKNEFQ